MIALDRAVDLIGTDLMEAQLVFAGHLKQHVRAGDVGLCKHEWVQDTLVNVCFGGKIDDRVNLVAVILAVLLVLHEMPNQLEVTDVPVDDFKFRILEVSVQVFDAGGVGHFVQHRDLNLWSGAQDVPHEVAADEAATAGDEQVFKVGQSHSPVVLK